MSKKYIKDTFTIIGGDRRQSVIAECLINCGSSVKIFADFENYAHIQGAYFCSDLSAACDGSNFLILPLPATRDGIKITDSEVSLEDVIRSASKCKVKAVLGGKLPVSFVDECSVRGIRVLDYYLSEDLQLKNALPSAEGALMLAMEHTDITVSGMKSLVCGYGRIGRCLSEILNKLGADVIVAARSESALAEANSKGFKTVNISSGTELLGLEIAVGDRDVIFNTVPHRIFSAKVLCAAKKAALYIEIASNPGGADVIAARKVGVRFVNAPSLPGKYAPATAGKYIYETITDILTEEKLISIDR